MNLRLLSSHNPKDFAGRGQTPWRNMQPMQIAICTAEDGATFAVADTNAAGGVCNDCRSDHDPDEAIRIDIYEVHA